MVCTYCGHDTKVTNSRSQKKSNGTWRRRRCLSCGAVFSSLERIDYETSLAIRDRTSHIIPFNRDQLFVSIYDACRHRATAVQDAGALTDTVVRKLIATSIADGVIDRESVVAHTHTTLRAFDMAAGVQYIAFHPLRK